MTALGCRITALAISLLYVLVVICAQLTQEEASDVRTHLKQGYEISFTVHDLARRMDRIEELNIPLRIDRLEQQQLEKERTNQLLYTLMVPMFVLAADKLVDWIAKLRRYKNERED